LFQSPGLYIALWIWSSLKRADLTSVPINFKKHRKTIKENKRFPTNSRVIPSNSRVIPSNYMGIAAQGLCGNEVEVHRALWAMSHGRGGRGGRGKGGWHDWHDEAGGWWSEHDWHDWHDWHDEAGGWWSGVAWASSSSSSSSSSKGNGKGAITSKGKGEGKDLETYDERPTMRDQETQTSDGVLCMTQDELKQTVLKQVEEWQTKFTKQLVQESAALEIISGPLQAAEDLERHVQECHTGRDEAIRKDSIRMLRDSLDALI